MPKIDLTVALDAMVKQAYFRRSRQLPANLSEMVECLKGDLLKYFRECPVEVVDYAITTSTLHDTDTPLSVAFFFAAVKKQWWKPSTNVHRWDNETEQRRPDFEQDTISLLDCCADYVATHADPDSRDPNKPLKGVVSLPAFNARKAFAYLTLRGQLQDSNRTAFMPAATLAINNDRMANRKHRLSKEEANDDPDVKAHAMRLAVLDWLKACNIRQCRPSDILNPLIDNNEYARKIATL